MINSVLFDANNLNDEFSPTECVAYLFKMFDVDENKDDMADCIDFVWSGYIDSGFASGLVFKLVRAVNLFTMEDVTSTELKRIMDT